MRPAQAARLAGRRRRAAKARGCNRSQTNCRVAAARTFRRDRDADSARMLRSVEKAHTNIDEIGQLAAKLGITAAARRHG